MFGGAAGQDAAPAAQPPSASPPPSQRMVDSLEALLAAAQEQVATEAQEIQVALGVRKPSAPRRQVQVQHVDWPHRLPHAAAAEPAVAAAAAESQVVAPQRPEAERRQQTAVFLHWRDDWVAEELRRAREGLPSPGNRSQVRAEPARQLRFTGHRTAMRRATTTALRPSRAAPPRTAPRHAAPRRIALPPTPPHATTQASASQSSSGRRAAVETKAALAVSGTKGNFQVVLGLAVPTMDAVAPAAEQESIVLSSAAGSLASPFRSSSSTTIAGDPGHAARQKVE